MTTVLKSISLMLAVNYSQEASPGVKISSLEELPSKNSKRQSLLLVRSKQQRKIQDINTKTEPISSDGTTAFSVNLNPGSCCEQVESGLINQSAISSESMPEAQPLAQHRQGGKLLSARRQQIIKMACAALTDLLDKEGSSLNIDVSTHGFLKNRISSTASEVASSGYWSTRTSTARISQLSFPDSATEGGEQATSLSSQSTACAVDDGLPFDINCWTTEFVKSLKDSEEERDSLSLLSIPSPCGGASPTSVETRDTVTRNAELFSSYCSSCCQGSPTSFISSCKDCQPKRNNFRGRSQSLPSNPHYVHNPPSLLHFANLKLCHPFLSSSTSLDSETTVGSPCELSVSGSQLSIDSASCGELKKN